MAVTGLSVPIVARYTDDGFGNITYTQGKRFAKAVEYSTEFGDSKGHTLYADNCIAETKNIFAGGTLNITTDDLDFEASKLLLGISEESVTYNGKTVKTLVNRDGDATPYVGFGVVVRRQKGGVSFFEATLLPKVAFRIPSESAKTEGESIEWQTPKISATIMRDDTPKHDWKIKAECLTEADAIEFLKWKLGMLPPALTVTSTAGTQTGKTAITAQPPKLAGNTYRYFVGAEVYLPDKDAAIPDTYAEWDGTAEIEAKSGDKLLLVEVSAEKQAKRAGITVVTVKEDAP